VEQAAATARLISEAGLPPLSPPSKCGHPISLALGNRRGYFWVVSYFGLSEKELEFLGAHVKSSDTAWEWGSGITTAFLAQRCRRVTTVEHIPSFAAQAILWAHNTGQRNVQVISAPPDLPYVEGGDDDGDLPTFRSYVESFVGKGVDVVLVDGRARIECVRYLLERAPFGPDPAVRVFVHDIDRPGLAPILEMMYEVERVERLALLRVRL